MSQNTISKGPTLREIAMQLERGEISENEFRKTADAISQQVAQTTGKIIQQQQ